MRTRFKRILQTAFFKTAVLPCLLLALIAAPAAAHAQSDYKNQFDSKPRQLYSKLDLTKKQYYACKAASDCAAVDMPCGSKVVVNKMYKDNLDGWYKFVAPRYKCANWLRPQQVKNITCTKNLCRADISVAPPVVDNSPAARNPLYCDTPKDCQPVTKSCGEKIVVNKKYGALLQKQYDDLKNVSHCFHIDGRTVKAVTCQNHTCGVELKIPLELADPYHPENPLIVKPVTVENPPIAMPPQLVSPQSRQVTP